MNHADMNPNDLIATLGFFVSICFIGGIICATIVTVRAIKLLQDDDFTFIPPSNDDEDDGDAWKRGGVGKNDNN